MKIYIQKEKDLKMQMMRKMRDELCENKDLCRMMWTLYLSKTEFSYYWSIRDIYKKNVTSLGQLNMKLSPWQVVLGGLKPWDLGLWRSISFKDPNNIDRYIWKDVVCVSSKRKILQEVIYQYQLQYYSECWG